MTNPYEFIGMIHTEGVNYVLKQFETPIKEFGSGDFLTVIERASEFTADSIHGAKKYSKEFNRIFLDTTNATNGNEEISPDLSKIRTEAMDYFIHILDSPTGNPNDYQEHLETHLQLAEESILKKIKQSQSIIILQLIGVAIAKSSLKLSKSKKRGRDSTKKIILEDLKGAAGGFSTQQDFDTLITSSIVMSVIALLREK